MISNIKHIITYYVYIYIYIHNWTLYSNRGNCGLEHVAACVFKTSWHEWSDSGGFKLRCWRSKSRSFGLHPRCFQVTVIFRCLKFSDERLGTTKYCTDCTATCKLTCTVFCLFVPIPQTVNIFAKFRESTDRHVLSKLILWNYAPDMLKSTQGMRLQQMFAERSMFIKAHLLVLKDSKRAWFKLAMLIQHLSSPWIPRGLVVLRSVLALFGTDSTHLFVCRSRGSYLPLQIVKDSCRQDSKQIRVDTSRPVVHMHMHLEACLAGMGLLCHSMSQCHRMLAVFPLCWPIVVWFQTTRRSQDMFDINFVLLQTTSPAPSSWILYIHILCKIALVQDPSTYNSTAFRQLTRRFAGSQLAPKLDIFLVTRDTDWPLLTVFFLQNPTTRFNWLNPLDFGTHFFEIWQLWQILQQALFLSQPQPPWHQAHANLVGPMARGRQPPKPKAAVAQPVPYCLKPKDVRSVCPRQKPETPKLAVRPLETSSASMDSRDVRRVVIVADTPRPAKAWAEYLNQALAEKTHNLLACRLVVLAEGAIVEPGVCDDKHPAVKELQIVAKMNNVIIAAGSMVEQDTASPGESWQTCALIGQDGLIGSYRKQMLGAVGKKEHVEEKLRIFNTAIGRIESWFVWTLKMTHSCIRLHSDATSL